MTDHLEAAIQAGADAVEAEATATAFNTPTAWVPADDAKIIITAALPDLEKHFAQDPTVRRAIIQELAKEAEAEAQRLRREFQMFKSTDAELTGAWLSAKLKEAENND